MEKLGKLKQEQIALLENSRIISNPDFFYLTQELKTFYQRKSPNLTKHFYSNLNVLLKEITLTENPTLQLKMSEKVYQWYQSKIQIDTLQIDHELNKLKPINLRVISKTPSPKSFLMPIAQENSFSEVTLKTNRVKHNEILKSKSFSKGKSYLKHWSIEKQRNQEDFCYKQGLKFCSITPEPDFKEKVSEDLSNRFDFSIKNRKTSIDSTRRNHEISELNLIKLTLARKKVPISSKCLEQGLCLYDFSLPSLNFPKGGELLIKRPILPMVSPIKKILKKRRKVNNSKRRD